MRKSKINAMIIVLNDEKTKSQIEQLNFLNSILKKRIKMISEKQFNEIKEKIQRGETPSFAGYHLTNVQFYQLIDGATPIIMIDGGVKWFVNLVDKLSLRVV